MSWHFLSTSLRSMLGNELAEGSSSHAKVSSYTRWLITMLTRGRANVPFGRAAPRPIRFKSPTKLRRRMLRVSPVSCSSERRRRVSALRSPLKAAPWIGSSNATTLTSPPKTVRTVTPVSGKCSSGSAPSGSAPNSHSFSSGSRSRKWTVSNHRTNRSWLSTICWCTRTLSALRISST